jgi:hypothetical protein
MGFCVVCMFTYALPDSICAIKSLNGCPARRPTKLAADTSPSAKTSLNLPGINTAGGAMDIAKEQ